MSRFVMFLMTCYMHLDRLILVWQVFWANRSIIFLLKAIAFSITDGKIRDKDCLSNLFSIFHVSVVNKLYSQTTFMSVGTDYLVIEENPCNKRYESIPGFTLIPLVT